jgi:cell division protein FtsB
VPIEAVRQSITDSAEQRSEERLGFTARRAAILAAVVCVLTLTIAGPVRTYFAQRTEMKQLSATEAALRKQIADLEGQKTKLGDPVFIAAQARERLGFVMPGDIPYQVQLPPGPWCPPIPRSIRHHAEQRALVHGAVEDHRRHPARPAPAPAAPAGTRSIERTARSECAAESRHPAAGSRWLTRPTSTRLPVSSGANRVGFSRSPTGAPTASRVSYARRRGCPTARRSRRCTT